MASKKKGGKKHGTRAYQKDTGGPSWDRNQEKPPDTDEMMALIKCRPDDQNLFRAILSKFIDDELMNNLSMTEMMDLAAMTMLQGKITGWMLAVDTPERLEEMREANKMWRSIIQIKSKMMNEARERAPIGGDLEGLAKILDEVEDAEVVVCEPPGGSLIQVKPKKT